MDKRTNKQAGRSKQSKGFAKQAKGKINEVLGAAKLTINALLAEYTAGCCGATGAACVSR
jgi:hypothetical protein